jgi:hypothetical protein
MAELTRTRYTFIDLTRGGAGGELCARFSVEESNSQTHEELLAFTTIEARILLWDDKLAHDPEWVTRDRLGFANYRQYVRALVEGLKRQAV